jgi:hypothetical protein
MWLQVSHDLFSFNLHSVVCFMENMWNVTQQLEQQLQALTLDFHLEHWSLTFLCALHSFSFCTLFLLNDVLLQELRWGKNFVNHACSIANSLSPSHKPLMLVTSRQATIIIGLHFSPHPLSFYSKAQVWRCMQVSRGREQGSSWSAVFKTSKSIHQSWNVIPE